MNVQREISHREGMQSTEGETTRHKDTVNEKSTSTYILKAIFEDNRCTN